MYKVPDNKEPSVLKNVVQSMSTELRMMKYIDFSFEYQGRQDHYGNCSCILLETWSISFA